MNEERAGECLRQVGLIRGHLGHRYSVAVNQVMVTTVKLSKWWLQLNQQNSRLSSVIVVKHVPKRSGGVCKVMYLITAFCLGC